MRLHPSPQAATPPPTGRDSATRVAGKGYRALLLLFISTVLLFGAIGSRLAYLQLIQHEHHRQLAENNRIRLIPHPPERGLILDRNGTVMAGTKLSHGVFVWPLAQPLQDWQPTIDRLASYLDMTAGEIAARLDRAGYNSPLPVRIMHNAPPEIVTRLKENITDLPGTIVQPEAVRHYPHGSLAAHLLGYTGEITQEALETAPTDLEYRLGDVVGQLGVERSYEPLLRGQWGGQQVEVDASGRVLEILGEQPALTGQPIQLGLDLQLQQVAETALANRKGAVVAIDPRNGEVLAMASYPTFDPNIFSSTVSSTQWEELQAQQFPFLNRAMRAYPPASTFKIVTTTAALESGAFSPKKLCKLPPILRWGAGAFGIGIEPVSGYWAFKRRSPTAATPFFIKQPCGWGRSPCNIGQSNMGLAPPPAFP